MYITVRETGEVLTVTDQFREHYGYNAGIETIIFADGTSWKWDEIQQASHIRGPNGNGDGSDTLHGSNLDDIFASGSGDDVMYGGYGADTYIYAKGDGNDRIHDAERYSENDTLRFTDLNAEDVIFSRHGNHMYITVRETGEVLTVTDQFREHYGYNAGIETIIFADGTTWNWDEIKSVTETGELPLAGPLSAMSTFSISLPEFDSIMVSEDGSAVWYGGGNGYQIKSLAGSGELESSSASLTSGVSATRADMEDSFVFVSDYGVSGQAEEVEDVLLSSEDLFSSYDTVLEASAEDVSDILPEIPSVLSLHEDDFSFAA